MNTRRVKKEKLISQLLRAISQPARLQILLTIGLGEACVCHLEAVLGFRQAYISQHLMALRKAKLLDTRREGRFVFYRLSKPQLLDLIRQAGEIAGIPAEALNIPPPTDPLPACECPDCRTDIQPQSQLFNL